MIEPIVEKLIELEGGDWMQRGPIDLYCRVFHEYGDLFHSHIDNFPIWGPAFLDEVGRGALGEVYGLSDRHVIKLPYLKRGLYLLRELVILLHLYENGVSVPKPEGIFKIAVNKKDRSHLRRLVNVEKAGLVMERVHGEEPYSANAIELMGVELDKCRRLGYICIDAGRSNAIYDTDHDKVYLIDFGSWMLTRTIN